MKTAYHIIFRRTRERHLPLRLRLRGPHDRGLEPLMDDPDELPSEVIDVASGELGDRRRRTPGR
jgi:hypothetical protein